MLLNFHFLVVLVHIFFSNTKTFKIPGKAYSDTTDFPMCLNYNHLETGETNYNGVHDDQHATAPAQIHSAPGIQYYNSTFFSTGD